MKLKLTKLDELKKMKTVDLDKYINEVKKQQYEFTHAVATNKEKQTHQSKLLKKAVARANTLKSIANAQQEGKEQ
ncbi:50S ribosomal protein L29 [Candidatus Nomurabacteria bacterium]|nr:50S ribosomal protein L29 [Candidatus Nomurabacteria bacterium]